MKEINFKQIEKKWQKKWGKAKCFHVNENSNKKKYYVLEMFPYPSASGLHMGHAFNYVIGDIYARFKRMNNFNVLYPMGYDALGLPAENAAIKEKKHPKFFTENAIKNFIRQQKELGLSYDWSRLIKTSDPGYYKWNQYFFIKFLENGLVYRKKAPVNYCEKCNTVLANEQVHNGKCWRHEDTDVEIKHLEQWFIKTTKYAEELLKEIDKLDWPERIKIMQKNWIGKSHGTEIDFEVVNPDVKPNFVLLHGYTGSPNANFFPWLKKELEKKKYKVSAPFLPNTNNPHIYEQVNYVLKNCKFDENTVLLGHSLGSVVALKVLEKLKKPISKLISVAGFCEPKFKDKLRPFEKTFDWRFDFDKIKNNVNEIKILRAKNDSAVFGERAESLKNKLSGTIMDFIAEDDHACGEKEPEVLNACLETWPIFTTRADTIFGVTFMVVSAQHPKLFELVTKKQKSEVENFLKKIKSIKQEDFDKLDKEGVFIGSYAINPINNEKIPIWIGNFVLADYGSGMVMAVPAHDERDFE
ncbi:MAG: alpha/beta fold hydrolase, partial [Nanoarchaeota archaeon]